MNIFHENNPRRIYWTLLIVVLALGLFLRVYTLENRPVHHDEGINGWFIENLIERGDYKYSPRHYHGPTFFYIAGLSSRILGLDIFSIRLVPALFGFLICLAPLFLREEMGRLGQLTTIFILSVCPANLFYSRYAIHETLFVCFYLFSALALYFYLFKGKKYALYMASLLLASASASKETIVVVIAALVCGISLAFLFSREGFREQWQKIKTNFSWKTVLIALVLFFLGLFSWFGLKGTGEFFKSYLFYLDLGVEKASHDKPWPYFLKLLWEIEVVVLVGGVCGGVAAIIRRRSLDLFLLGWAFAIITAHSIIPYKTPWIIISLTTPLCFLCGTLVGYLEENIKRKETMAFLLATIFMFSTYALRTGYSFSFSEFEEPANKYIYSHTFKTAHDLEKRIKELIAHNPRISVVFATNEYWPFPFLLRGYKQVIFLGSMPVDVDSQVIIARDQQHGELMGKFKKPHTQENYALRPGVNLELFIPWETPFSRSQAPAWERNSLEATASTIKNIALRID